MRLQVCRSQRLGFLSHESRNVFFFHHLEHVLVLHLNVAALETFDFLSLSGGRLFEGPCLVLLLCEQFGLVLAFRVLLALQLL